MATNRQLLDFKCDAVPADSVVVTRLKGRERISSPFEFNLELVSEDSTLDLRSIVGQTATMHIRQTVQLGDGSTGSKILYVHGVIAAIAMGDQRNEWTTWRARVVPRIWKLQRSSGNRVFLSSDVPTIVSQVLQDHGLSDGVDFEFKLSGSYPTRDYVVQYEETDYDFVSRWLQHEGIFWFVEHTEDREKVVFGDDTSSYSYVGVDHLDYSPQGADSDATSSGSDYDDWFAPVLDGGDSNSTSDGTTAEVISSIYWTEQPVPQRVALKDYNWRNPSDPLEVSLDVDTDLGIGTQWEYNEHYKTTDEGDQLANVRAGEHSCRRAVVGGASDCRAFRAGATFTLSAHFRSSLNAAYVLTDVIHEAQQSVASDTGGDSGGSYGNRFRAIPAEEIFRPRRETEWPSIKGFIHATVDSSMDDESKADINDDGMYRLRLPWDVGGADREAGKASRYVRMMQPTAGNGYGMHFPLRPGVEVMLAHIDGDPDRPVIAGAVPNRETMSPVTSGNSDKNIIMSQSGNTIEIDDSSGNEGIAMGNSNLTGVFSMRSQGAGGGGGAGGYSGGGNSAAPATRLDDAVSGLTGSITTTGSSASASMSPRAGLFSGPLASLSIDGEALRPAFDDDTSGYDSFNDSDTSDSTTADTIEDSFLLAHCAPPDSTLKGSPNANFRTWADPTDSSKVVDGTWAGPPPSNNNNWLEALLASGPGATPACINDLSKGMKKRSENAQDIRSEAGVFSAARTRYCYTVGADQEVINGHKGTFVRGSNIEYIKGDNTHRYNEVNTENTELRCKVATNFTLYVGMHDTGGDQVNRPSASECMAVGRIFNVVDTYAWTSNQATNLTSDASVTDDASKTWKFAHNSWNVDCSKISDNEVRDYVRAGRTLEVVDLVGGKTEGSTASKQGLPKENPFRASHIADVADGTSASDGEQRGVLYAKRVSDAVHCRDGDGVVSDYTWAKRAISVTDADTQHEETYGWFKFGFSCCANTIEIWVGTFAELFFAGHSSLRIGWSFELDAAQQCDVWLYQKADFGLGYQIDAFLQGVKFTLTTGQEYDLKTLGVENYSLAKMAACPLMGHRALKYDAGC